MIGQPPDQWDILSIIIAAISAIGAIIAAFYTKRQTDISRKALIISEAELAGTEPNLQLYLFGTQKWSDIDDFDIYQFHLQITNGANVTNSVVRLELEMQYNDDRRQLLITPHKPEISQKIPTTGTTPLNLPYIFQPREAVVGHALFEVKHRKGAFISAYMIRATDAHDKITSIEPIFVNEGVVH